MNIYCAQVNYFCTMHEFVLHHHSNKPHHISFDPMMKTNMYMVQDLSHLYVIEQLLLVLS